MLTSARRPFRRPLVRLASSRVSASRRGRNLTERYRQLENTTRTKPTLQSDGLVHTRTSIPPNTIAGFVIPQEPRAPAEDECCMSGCAVCVYDLYEEELAAYKDSVTTLRAALSERQIPEFEWPAHVRTGTVTGTPTTAEKSRGAVLDAFGEMERALKEKRDKRAAVEAEKRARGDVLVGGGGIDLRAVYEGIRWIIFPNR